MKARSLLIVIGGLAAMLALCLVGIDDPGLEHSAYCKNVADGTWPDYQGTFKEECGGNDPPKFNEDLTK